ncbi:HtaA domain-containing protein [Cellulosimicrobium terreum]|nr:HtaA domain-containing protein [Cellulosimicrobium terreum]
MRTSTPGRVRRGLASLLTGALVAGATVVGIGAPAQAAPTEIQAGSATWNFKDSWTRYIGGAGTITPALVAGQSVYPSATGSVDPETAVGEIRLGGSVRYSAHGGVLDVTISDVRLAVTSPTSGVVTADFASSGVTSGDVKVADVTVSTARDGDTLVVTADGALAAGVGDVDSQLASYVGQAMSTLTATLDVPAPVAPATPTSTTLAVAPSGTSVEGDAVTLTATVAPEAEGTVAFRAGDDPLGSADVSDGVARLETSELTVGEHSLSAAFAPADPEAFVASASAAAAHTVTAVETPEEPEEPEVPVADPEVTVSPSGPVDPAVENTFTISGTGFVGAGAVNGAYVLLGDASIWSGDGPLVSTGWLAQGWVQSRQITDGGFTTTLTVPAGTLDPSTEYTVATSAAHGLSVTDRSLDTFTTIAVQQPEPEVPVADPKVTVSPSGPVDPAVENTFTISGTGFVGAGAVNGAYVLLGDASIWSGDGPLVSTGWLAQGWVQSRQMTDGSFTTTLTVPAGTLDPSTEYVVATSAAHGLSVTDRSLDSFTPITVEQPAHVWAPEIDVYAADGTTPLGDAEVTVGDTLVVKGSGFDPAANVGGRGVPIPATLPQGTYVVFGSFAEQWRPSEGAASSGRKVGSQSWALAESVLDQVPAQFQAAIRGQWTDIADDGTFEARLVVKNPAPLDGGRFGVYTYGAGGVTNADQELYAPVAYDVPELTVTAAPSTVVAGGSSTLTVTGLVAADAVKGVTLAGTAATFTRQGATLTLTVPEGTPAGDATVVVTTELGVTGSTTLTVTAPPVDPDPVADPEVTVSPSGPVDPAVENTFTISGTGFVGAGAVNGAYVLLGDASIWSGDGPLVSTGWLAQGWVQSRQMTDGSFTTTLTVPAGTLDPSTEYVVATSAAHGLSVTDRTLDTFTPIEVEQPEPVVSPTVTVSPSGPVDPAVESTFTISGTGFVGAGAANGAYVLLGDASIWSGDGPLVAAGWLAQGWVMPNQITDGTFSTTLTVPAGSFDPSTEYVVATSAAHGLSVSDRSLDTFTTVEVQQPAPDAVATSTTLTASPAKVVEGGTVTLTAKVSPTAATGTVTFTAGGKALGAISATTGTATLTASTLAVGEHEVTARFVPADTTAYLGSTSPVATVTVTAKPVTPTDPTGPTTAGSLTWGVKESFRTYIQGSIAKGGATASDGASVVDGIFRFGQADGGTWSASTGRGTVAYDGSVRFTGHDGQLDLVVENPVVDVTVATTARLLVDVRSKGLDGSTVDEKRVAFATLALGSPSTAKDGSVTYTDAVATLTADGARAFSGFYAAGDALDPVTFTVGAVAQPGGGNGGSGDGGTIGTPVGGGDTPVDPEVATLSVSQAGPGDDVTISGVGFGSREDGIRSEIRSTPQVLATGVTANAGGAASTTVTIPADIEPGEHTLVLVGADHTASAPITIVGADTTASGSGSGGSAEEKCYAQGVNGATLSWGVSDRFRAYVTGPIAKGSVSTSGVGDNGSTFTWSGGKGSFNTDLGKGRAAFGGTVSFSGHEGILDLRLSNPRVVVNGATGTLVVDVQSSDMEGTTSSSSGVAFATLNLSGTKSTSGSTITWTGAPATLTAAGAAAFAGYYDAGTALAPVTFSFPVGGEVECDVYSGLAATGSDGANVALTALALLLAGTVLVGATRRRVRVRATA